MRTRHYLSHVMYQNKILEWPILFDPASFDLHPSRWQLLSEFNSLLFCKKIYSKRLNIKAES